MQRTRRGDVTRHTTHTARECGWVCRRRDRRTHDEVGGARSARRLARGSALARRASPVPALTEPSRRCNARGAVMSLDTRRTRHESACGCVDGATGARRRSRRRSVGTTTRSRLGARSAVVAGVGSDGAEPAMQRKRRGDVTRHTTHTARECVWVCRRRDWRTHDEVGGARSARRLARGSALARRASPVSALTEPSRRCNARGAVMSPDTRRTQHEGACGCVDGATGARATKSAALGRHADSLAARRLLVGSRRCRL